MVVRFDWVGFGRVGSVKLIEYKYCLACDVYKHVEMRCIPLCNSNSSTSMHFHMIKENSFSSQI